MLIDTAHNRLIKCELFSGSIEGLVSLAPNPKKTNVRELFSGDLFCVELSSGIPLTRPAVNREGRTIGVSLQWSVH